MAEIATVTDRPVPVLDTKSLVVAAEEVVVKGTESPALVTNGQAPVAVVVEEALGVAVENEYRSVSVHFEILFIHVLPFF